MMQPGSRCFRFAVLLVLLWLAGCASAPPDNPDNLCDIFTEKRSWYEAAVDMQQKWGTPVHVPMAMMYQESSFRHDARPPMRYFLWIIPLGRASSAYGYSQAKTPAWKDYMRETGNRWASRDDFDDAMDFMGWYTNKTHRLNGVSKWDAYRQYLNYHEGWGGYRRGSYKRKRWLTKTAGKVEQRSRRYAGQYRQCQAQLERGWLWRMLFG